MMMTALAIAIALVSSAQNPQTPAQPESTGKISGVVTRSDTNEPIKGVTIRLIRWEAGRGQPFPS